MVQANSTLVEREGVGPVREFMKPDERLIFDEPDGASKRTTCAMVGSSGTKASF